MKFSKFSKLSLVSSLVALSFTVMSCSSTKKSDSSLDANQKAVEAQPLDTQNPDSSKYKTIYFDFNKYSIRPDQVARANSIANILMANPNIKIEIQGNTDDRGSTEYNMALGTKRADSLKKYLVAHGVVANNISTVSFGKERPAVPGTDESAWSKNRRDDVIEKK